MKVTCAGCGKHMGEIRDATLRKGMVVYCDRCADKLKADTRGDVPEFLKIFTQGGKR